MISEKSFIGIKFEFVISKYDDFLIPQNRFYYKKNYFLNIKNYILISIIRIIYIKYYFDIRKYLQNMKTAPHIDEPLK